MGLKHVDRIEAFATATGGVQIALAEAFASAIAVGYKLADRIEVYATAAGGVQIALTEAVAAGLAVG